MEAIIKPNYNNRTYCPFYKDCLTGATCGRAMVKEVVDAARTLDLYLDHYIFEPSCFVFKY